MRRHNLIALALAGALATGCAVGPDYRRPLVTTPEQVRGHEAAAGGATEAASLADRAWWEIFQDDVLKSLIDEALENGYDVRLAAARVEEARANAGIARSEFYPAIQAGGGWSRSRRPVGSTLGSAPINLYDVNLGLSWEVEC